MGGGPSRLEPSQDLFAVWNHYVTHHLHLEVPREFRTSGDELAPSRTDLWVKYAKEWAAKRDSARTNYKAAMQRTVDMAQGAIRDYFTAWQAYKAGKSGWTREIVQQAKQKAALWFKKSFPIWLMEEDTDNLSHPAFSWESHDLKSIINGIVGSDSAADAARMKWQQYLDQKREYWIDLDRFGDSFVELQPSLLRILQHLYEQAEGALRAYEAR